MPAYNPGAGLTSAFLVATAVYQFNKHWGVLSFVNLDHVMGPSTNSPLTQRTTAPVFAIGAAYMF